MHSSHLKYLKYKSPSDQFGGVYLRAETGKKGTLLNNLILQFFVFFEDKKFIFFTEIFNLLLTKMDYFLSQKYHLE